MLTKILLGILLFCSTNIWAQVKCCKGAAITTICYDTSIPYRGLKPNTVYDVAIYDGGDIVAYKQTDSSWVILNTTRAISSMVGFFEDEVYKFKRTHLMNKPTCKNCTWNIIYYLHSHIPFK